MKEQSQYAQVAAIIRKELKRHGIACRVTSRSFSMGNSVSVRIYDQTPEVRAKVEAFCDQFRAGDFDGMTDSYSYRKTSGPTAKWIDVTNEISDDLRGKARAYVASRLGNLTSYELEDESWRVLRASWGDSFASAFWSAVKPRIRLAA